MSPAPAAAEKNISIVAAGEIYMNNYKIRLDETVKFLKDRLPETPRHLLILGSGLGQSFDSYLQDKLEIPYEEIPGFPRVTVEGHAGSLVFGKVRENPVILMKGRFHYYEGYDMEEVVFPVRVFAALGIKSLYLTNAAGGLGDAFRPGDLMLIEDHISFFCPSPLRGKNLDELGPRFPDQSHIYDSEKLKKTADALKIELKQGVYCFTQGPMYETPAEIKLVKLVGGHAVGMSTVPEAITASHAGMRIRAVSVITNFAAGISKEALSHEDVVKVGALASKNLARLIIESLD